MTVLNDTICVGGAGRRCHESSLPMRTSEILSYRCDGMYDASLVTSSNVSLSQVPPHREAAMIDAEILLHDHVFPCGLPGHGLCNIDWCCLCYCHDAEMN